MLSSSWRWISRHGALGPRGQWPKQTFLPVGRDSFFSASQLCRRRVGGLACALFIRRLPSRCLPGRSQTGRSYNFLSGFAKAEAGPAPGGSGEADVSELSSPSWPPEPEILVSTKAGDTGLSYNQTPGVVAAGVGLEEGPVNREGCLRPSRSGCRVCLRGF